MYYNYMENFSSVTLGDNYPKYCIYHDDLFIKKVKNRTRTKICLVVIHRDMIIICKNESQEMENWGQDKVDVS